ncbi:uncharacterized protein CC84DRAFT_1007133 [Paraphaeosphaeria sporulosa]|uniref:Uncharacterized protein n=1 Tax=Paraphaeosphaeria sporulosa TaxID=1460663 RepID=A0A177C616_9PLEO|nr:uncharacterized protein CC84DRAFT_1007133 [Paraphaeosphaeria sporulosa]OAG02218.1 hypothetical protein CC84DRAFT_1007133 [Paraphaeosphaeria sporulosa]
MSHRSMYLSLGYAGENPSRVRWASPQVAARVVGWGAAAPLSNVTGFKRGRRGFCLLHMSNTDTCGSSCFWQCAFSGMLLITTGLVPTRWWISRSGSCRRPSSTSLGWLSSG